MAEGDSTPSLLLFCSRCKQTKPLEQFRRRSNRSENGKRLGRWSYCHDCERQRQKTPQGRISQRNSTRRFLQKLREQNPAELRRRERQSNLRRLYGMELAEYDTMLAAQGGGCAICGETEGGGRWKRRLHVDHDHRTGRIRGLLCHGCNVGVGHFGDRPELFFKAAQYLSVASQSV